MAKISFFKRIFVRQSAEHDCGMACLQTIFNYYGLRFNLDVADCNLSGALSLRQMKSLCAASGVATRAVEMEPAFLKTLQQPVILHTVDDFDREHFIICFQAIKRRGETLFIIGDPARQVFYMDETELYAKWQSHAALYFEIGDTFKVKQYASGWRLLWQLGRIPVGLIPAFSVLTLISAAFGVGMSWLLQRGMYDNRLLQGPVMTSVLILLLIVYIGRGMANYIKQYLLIKVNLRLNDNLVARFIQGLFTRANKPNQTPYGVSGNLRDIQKVQAAVSGFIAVLCSDGTLIAALLGAAFYFLPLAGLADLLCLVVAVVLIVNFTKAHVTHNTNLSYFSRTAENMLDQDCRVMNSVAWNEAGEISITRHSENFKSTMRLAEKVGVSLARISLLLDLLQTLNLAFVFFIGFWQFSKSAISYNALMIAVVLSYLLSSLIPKILNALIVLQEGVDAAIQLSNVLGS